MADVTNQIRSVYYRALVVALFPFVFAVTYLEQVAPGWFSGFATGFKFSLLFSALSSAILLACINLYLVA